MPLAAAIIPAVIGAGGAVIASSNNRKAANSASAQAQTAARENNALQERTYSQNAARLDPFTQRGNMAGETLNALLSGGTGADDAFARFRDGTGFNFIRDETLNATRGAFAGRSAGQSGAAMRALQDRASNLATVNGINPFMNALQQQQQTGLIGASSLAGVGQNFANSVSNNNNSAAGATGNAALASAYNTNQAIGQGVGAFTNLLGSSFGGGGGGGYVPGSATAMTPGVGFSPAFNAARSTPLIPGF